MVGSYGKAGIVYFFFWCHPKFMDREYTSNNEDNRVCW